MQNAVNDLYSDFIAKRTYARWIDEKQKRESWFESVARFEKFVEDRVPKALKENYRNAIHLVYNKQVMPSMRFLWSAGSAAEENNFAIYNCAYLAMDEPAKFGEMLYVLMHGTGVGFSVERQFIGSLPAVPSGFQKEGGPFLIDDSKLGWKQAYDYCIRMLFDGYIPSFDYNLIRPKGARLKTFGGRACLTGDTIVYKDRKKTRGYNEVTIRQLYEMKNRIGKWAHVPVHFNDIKLRSLDESTGAFYRNQLLDVVDNGIASVYEIVTENGYRIKATDNHRFMDDSGEYKFLANFNIGEEIAVNGSKEKKTGICVDCGCAISRKSKRCKECSRKNQLNPFCSQTTARQRKDCRDSLKDSCENCGHDGSLSNLQRHHKDENPYNNAAENLQTLCEKCHRKIHFKQWTFGDPYSHKYMSFDKIISITYVGQEQVYDLCMEAPNHNFVANGFVSHNSGPAPLKQLIEFTIRIFSQAAGKKLNSIEVHDICCMIANCVVVGGVRRSACISFSNLSDQRMKHAKDGQFWLDNPQRSMANNSVAYTDKPDCAIFTEEWLNLMRSGSGERGIINVSAIKEKGKRFNRENIDNLRLNPCAEAILQDRGLCNLTEVVVRPKDTVDSLKEKIASAVLIGCLQATYTHLPNVSPKWKENAEKERLLGVSLTGVCDNPLFRRVDEKTKELLRDLRNHAHESSKKFSCNLGIAEPKQITLVKPSGTVSQLVNSSSGLHPRYSDYYIRRVRVNAKDPIARLLVDKQVPWNYEVGQTEEEHNTLVFDFPMKSPRGSINRHQWTAIEQLEYWKMFNDNWSDGNPSVTIYVSEDEWVEVGAWVYKNWNSVCGLSFLPKDSGVYQLAPYEELDESQYQEEIKKWKHIHIDFDKDLLAYEIDDTTEGAKTFACTGGSCEL